MTKANISLPIMQVHQAKCFPGAGNICNGFLPIDINCSNVRETSIFCIPKYNKVYP